MSKPEPRIVDIQHWVDRARRDPAAYLERQATEIVLTAIGLLPSFGSQIYLKGGILMALFYDSPRATADVDFTTTLKPSAELPGELRTALNTALPRAAALLGFPDLVLQVQAVKERPKPFASADIQFPALYVTVAYARRGSRGERHVLKGQGPDIIELEVSFNEPIHAIEIVRLGAGGPLFSAYALTDLIAEKFRALLQQVHRNRYRRQDVYDIAHLANRFPLNAEERSEILASFLAKCAARNITPIADSISDPAVRARAMSEWDTLKQELGELPDFHACFRIVEALYHALPWATA